MALKTDVVGGWGDGAARGGNERAVGWINANRDGTRDGNNVTLVAVSFLVGFSIMPSISTEALS